MVDRVVLDHTEVPKYEVQRLQRIEGWQQCYITPGQKACCANASHVSRKTLRNKELILLQIKLIKASILYPARKYQLSKLW